MSPNLKAALDEPYALSEKGIRFFRENGFVKLKNVLSAEILAYYSKEITQKVIDLNKMHLPMEERDTYHKAFLQIANLWRKSDIAKEFAFSKRLARIAAELMGATGVRMYHDQALYKEPGGGITPWHADQFYWPLATEKCCTVWIPLQETPLNKGPLAFSAKSQHFAFGRDLPISDESEIAIQKALTDARFEHVAEPFELGEVSFHYGWTFHHAGANSSSHPRAVMTVIYMDENMRLKQPDNENQKIDWEVWCPGAEVGEVIDTPLNPVIYSSLTNGNLS